jgi:hypothetical protein
MTNETVTNHVPWSLAWRYVESARVMGLSAPSIGRFALPNISAAIIVMTSV